MNDNSKNPNIFSVDSANATVISSSLVAEHSYCASFNSAAVTTGASDSDQERIEDELFQLSTATTSPSSVLKEISTGGYSIELGDDVNFDGFTYSIPLSDAGDSMEDILGGMSGVGDVRTVEIFSSNEPAQFGECNDPGVQDLTEDIVKRKTGSSYSRPRRRDYIEDSKARKAHFLEQLRKLASQVHRAMCRTGCECDLTAVFDGQRYNPTLAAQNPTSVAAGNSDYSDLKYSSKEIVDHSDDHRYAAPMLTQQFSSSDVCDHQYNASENGPSEPDMELLDDISLHSTGNPNKRRRQRTTTDPFDFVRARPARDNIFNKLINSIFHTKIILEQRTGACVTLTFEYERCSFNSDNYQNAFEILRNSRNAKKKVTTNPPLAPKPVPGQAKNNQLTFILPNSMMTTPIYIPTSTVVPDHCGMPVKAPQIFPQADSARSGDRSSNLVGANFPLSMDAPLALDSDPDMNPYMTLDIDNPDSPLIDNPLGKFTGETGSLLTFSLNQTGSQSHVNSPVEISPGGEMKDFGTNTEPICSICLNNEGSDDNKGNKKKFKSENPFWIRCNDPFCYDMVHASCVGFMITHDSHLKQLPAFYCKSHR